MVGGLAAPAAWSRGRADPVPRLRGPRLRPRATIKIFATGLAAGILLDATVVRALLVPALVSLFGDWNWWMPEAARRVLLLPPRPEPAGRAHLDPQPAGAGGS